MTQPQPPDAYVMLVQMLRQWGLESLAPDVLRLLQEGHSQEQVSVLLQDTDTYKRRFVGNEARRKAGLPVLSAAEYLSVESSYRRILEGNGLPAGFYDSPSDFAGWIGDDVAPTEIERRVGYAVDAANRLDAGTKRAFQEFYGVGTTDLAAFFLDRERAMPLVQKVAKAARIGAAGYNQGVGFDRARAERLAESTIVGENEIETAVSAVAETGRDVGHLGQLYGDRGYTAETASEEVFFGDVKAKRRRQQLIDRERAEFAGSAGVGRSSLSKDTGLY